MTLWLSREHFLFTPLCSVFKWYATFFLVFLKDSSCTLLLSAGLLMCQKGTEWTFIQGLWRYTRPYLSHYALMKFVLRPFQPRVSSEWNAHPFIWCFIVFKRCSFEHMNKRKCEHLWEQPNCLAAFFFFFFFFCLIQLMIVFSFCKQLVGDVSVRDVNYCFFNKLICSENWCSTVTHS